MKKSLFIAVLLALSFPSFSHAQVFTPEQQTSLDSLKQELISLLTQEIALLQAKISELQTAQTQTAQAVTSIQQQIAPVSAPVVGAVLGNVLPITAPTYAPVTTVSLGNPVCFSDEGVSVPVNITGTDWDHIQISYQDFTKVRSQTAGADYSIVMSQRQPGGAFIQNPDLYHIRFTNNYNNISPSFNLWNVPASYDVTGTIYDRNKLASGTFSQTINVDGSCRTALSDTLIPMTQ